MRIIVVTPAAPHPFGDAAARWFYVLISGLAARGHEVVALAATEETEQRVSEAKQWLSKQSSNLTFLCLRLDVDANSLRRKWRNFIRPRSELLQDSALTALLQNELAKGYDVLHLEQMSTGWLGVNVPRALLNIHFFDVIDWSRKKMGLADRKALWQARRATKRLLRAIPNIRLLTERLKETAQSINPDPDAHYWVVPLALDTSLYALQPPAQQPVVGLVGSMHWEPSRSAAERLITCIWPLIKKTVPEARLYIAGWNATRYLRQYSSLPDLTIEENLTHPTDFFSKAAVMVYAPSRGSGMKVKVMEAMAYGVPVVTTWEGVEGIDYENERACCVAETDAELATAACRLLENPTGRLEMRLAARHLIEERYSSGPVLDKMIGVYQDILCAGARGQDCV